MMKKRYLVAAMAAAAMMNLAGCEAAQTSTVKMSPEDVVTLVKMAEAQAQDEKSSENNVAANVSVEVKGDTRTESKSNSVTTAKKGTKKVADKVEKKETKKNEKKKEDDKPAETVKAVEVMKCEETPAEIQVQTPINEFLASYAGQTLFIPEGNIGFYQLYVGEDLSIIDVAEIGYWNDDYKMDWLYEFDITPNLCECKETFDNGYTADFEVTTNGVGVTIMDDTASRIAYSMFFPAEATELPDNRIEETEVEELCGDEGDFDYDECDGDWAEETEPVVIALSDNDLSFGIGLHPEQFMSRYHASEVLEMVPAGGGYEDEEIELARYRGDGFVADLDWYGNIATIWQTSGSAPVQGVSIGMTLEDAANVLLNQGWTYNGRSSDAHYDHYDMEGTYMYIVLHDNDGKTVSDIMIEDSTYVAS